MASTWSNGSVENLCPVTNPGPRGTGSTVIGGNGAGPQVTIGNGRTGGAR